ncbi:MAG: MFS transporter, partial [Youngiibacter sp.]|nr:MFS transporter [Youngiibacter sp.]
MGEKRAISDKSGWKTLLSKNFILVLAISCFNQFANMAVSIPVNQFGRQLGLAATALGLIATLQSVFKMICRPGWGFVVDKLNKRTAMTIAMSIQVLAYVIYAFTASVPVFILGRFMEGVSFALVGTSVYATLGFAVDRRALGTAMGFYATFPQIVKAAAPVASMKIFTTYGAKWSFMTAAFCTVVSIFLAQFISFRKDVAIAQKIMEKAEVNTKQKSIRNFSNLFSVKGFLFFPVLLGDGFQNGVLSLIVIIYATSLNIPAAGAFFFSVQALVTVFLAVPFGIIHDKLGGKFSVVFAYICRAFGSILLAINPTYTSFMIAGILCGTARPGNNVLMTDAMKLQPKSRFGIANSTHMLLADLSVMIGSALGGILVDKSGYSTCFIVTGVILLISAGFY